MANTQGLRRRIRSIRGTRQITKAMEMVAASKMRRAQEASLQTRTYAHQALELLTNLAKRTDSGLHPLLVVRPVEKVLAIVVTSDRGLCGGYNSQILRQTMQFLQDNQDKQVELITVGRKGESFLRRAGANIIATFNDFPTYPTSLDIAPIAKIAIDGYSQGQYDRVTVIFTKFVSTLKQLPMARVLLPLSLARIGALLEETTDEVAEYEYLYEPEVKLVLAYILPRLSEMQIFHAVLEAIAAEYSARMMAMKNASENANELIDDLTLTYNSARQASITQELAEVSAGAEGVR